MSKILFCFLILFAGFIFIGSASAANLDVGPTGHTYTNISSAVNAASPGDTITVYDNNGSPYTYHDNPMIDKNNLTLIANGNVTVTPLNTELAPSAVFYLDGNNDILQGFSVIGQWNGLDITYGIHVTGTYNSIQDNIINGFGVGIKSFGVGTSITNNTISNVGEAIWVLDVGTTAKDIDISDNKIDSTKWVAISLQDIIGKANISGNTITNSVAGIDLDGCVSSDDPHTVKSITISSNTLKNMTNSGISTTNCQGLVIENNIIKNCNEGVEILTNYVSGVAANEISWNTISDNKLDGILDTFSEIETIKNNNIYNNGVGIHLKGSSIGIYENVIYSNTIGISLDDAIIPNETGNTLLPSYSNTIAGNNIYNNGDGISDVNLATVPGMADYPNTIRFNRIVNNTYWALVNYSSENLDATDNWWGSNSSPSSKIIGTVTYDPWLVLTIHAWPTFVYAGNSNTVTADLNHDSSGWIPNLYNNHIPDGINVTFTTDKGSIKSPVLTVQGAATSILFVNFSQAGTAHVSATVDNQTVNISVPIKALTIAQISSGIKYVLQYYNTYHILPSYVVLLGQRMTMPQYLQILTLAVLNPNGFTIPVSLSRTGPAINPIGTFRSGNLALNEYLTVAKNINNFFINNSRAPNYATTSLGRISFNDLVYAFSRIVSFYDTNKQLPNYVQMNRLRYF